MPAVSEKQRRAMYAAAEGHSNLGIPRSVGEEFVGGRKDAAARGDCAGILFRVRKNGPLYLLLKRSDTGEWCIPGGHMEEGETPMDAAERECVEEIGGCPDGLRWAVRANSIPSGKGLFVCFLQDVASPFKPELNSEHTNWGWFSPDALPQPMHRKVAETIERVTGNELDISKRMAKGELLSPQRYENMWLFDIRITGTETSYRSSLKEYVYRPPADFLTEEFVQRCNGLPLIFEHPRRKTEKAEEENPQVILDSDNFRDRSIGSVFLPYIRDDEVWGIAKVFDDDAALLMRTSHASTSPAVVFRDAGSTETVKLEDGSTVLIEGKPSYLDHIAICEEGVWDKGGEPTGVNLTGDSIVDHDNAVPAWADELIKGHKDMAARLDAIENGRKDGESEEERKKAEAAKRAEEEALRAGKKEESEEEKAIREANERKDAEEKARKDAEEKARLDSMGEEERKKEEEEKRRREEHERADAQASTIRGLQEQLAAVHAQVAVLTKPRTNDDRDQLSRIQRRAEGVAMAFGDSNAVTPPMFDESPVAYRKRCAALFQKHSPKAKGVNLRLLDDTTFQMVEDQIYADAQTVAASPAAMPKGRLHASMDDSTGHRVTTYTGDPEACWAPFKAPGFTGKINKDVGKRTH